jgi:glycosyltransferase involved in cell wall biosynthesis
VVVAFGRLISRKGFDDLLKAFRIVRDKMKSRLIIIGDGEEHNNLQNLSYSLSLEDDVTLTGYLDNPYEILSSADVFVLSSRWEGFGNVIIEAMACGVPVISTDCPYGPNEIITHGVNGLLVPVGDVQAMAEAIVTLLRDRALRTSLAEAGRKRAQDFSVDKMVAEYEKVFERVAS